MIANINNRTLALNTVVGTRLGSVSDAALTGGRGLNDSSVSFMTSDAGAGPMVREGDSFP